MSENGTSQAERDGNMKAEGLLKRKREPERAAEQGARAAADTMKQAAQTAEESAEEAADEARSLLGSGMRSMADALSPLTENAERRVKTMVEASGQVTQIYQDLTEKAGEDAQAMGEAYNQLRRGLLRMQQGYLDCIKHSLSNGRRKPRDLLFCTSPVEFAQVQRDLYQDGLSFMMESSAVLMRQADEVLRGAVKPLESRAGH